MLPVRSLKVPLGLQNLCNSSIIREGVGLLPGLGSANIVLIEDTKLAQVRMHGIGGHEGEERVDTVLRVMVGQCAKEQPAHGATETEGIGIPLAVGEAPRGEVVGGKVMSEEAVTSSESDGITQNCTADGVT